MKRLLFSCVLFVMATAAIANNTPAGEVDTSTGRIVVNGEKLYVNLQYDGRRMFLHNEHILSSAGRNPGLFLSLYPDGTVKNNSLTQHIIIIDATGKELRRSNVLDTGIDFEWGDNNYVLFDNGAMYFGVFTPKRMQFVYRDGKLEENKGAWRGPAKPEIYIEPTGKDPCFNVNGVEACREELEREKAAKQAKRKHKATPPATTK